jgi:hypothetical protein
MITVGPLDVIIPSGYDGLIAFVTVDFLDEVPMEAVIVGVEAPPPASAE